MKELLLDSKQACAELGISRSTLTQWLEKQWIVPVQQLSGGAYVFSRAEVDRAASAAAVAERARAARQGAA